MVKDNASVFARESEILASTDAFFNLYKNAFLINIEWKTK